jgi:ubiquinone biosynthesis protein
VTRWVQLRRLLHVLRVLAYHGLVSAIARSGWTWPRRIIPLARLTGPQRFRRLFEDLGGSFIKFGQMLALQPDIVTLEYCDELFNLLDRIPPFPYEDVERVFVEELGAPPGALFEAFEREPLAAASIGQVHVGWLGGRKVAVKVQRPSVDVDFVGDIRLMTLAMKFVRRFEVRSLYWTLEPIGEFVEWTREELDYRREARYADKLRRNAEGNLQEKIPAVLWEPTTRRILVLEFLEGTTVLDYLRALGAGDEVSARRLRGAGFDPDRFARHIIDNFLGDAFQHGVFHADLHPANLLVLPGDVVGYVDFGITGVLSRYSRRYLVAMTLAYTRADVAGMTDAFFRLTSSDADADPARFRRELEAMSREWYSGEGSETVFKKNFTLVMLDMLTLSRRTGIWPERDVIKYIRSAIAADGLITRFAPGFNVGRYLEDVCQRWVAWETRRASLRYESLTALAASGGRLANDGAVRAFAALDRLTSGDMLGRVDITTRRSSNGRLSRRTLRVAAVVVTLTALFGARPSAPRAAFGLNLFTVELALMAGALVLLADSIRRLAAAD